MLESARTWPDLTRLQGTSCERSDSRARSSADEEQGIYRGEVTEIMWRLADIASMSERSWATLRETTMKRKKRKKIVLLTPEERAAQEERTQRLMELIRRAEIELATGKRPPPDFSPSSP